MNVISLLSCYCKSRGESETDVRSYLHGAEAGLGLGRQRFVKSVEATGVAVRQLARAATSRTAWL